MKKAEGNSKLKRWRVKRARAYKSRATSRHEYISLTLVDPDNKTTYVSIERMRGDPSRIPSDSTDIDPNIDLQPLGLFSSSNSSISSISSVSDSLSPTRFADDRIAPLSASGMMNGSDELIYELYIDGDLYLYELAILALIVHEVNTSYLLMTNNCYHYAGTIMKVLEEKYDTLDAAQGANAGKWCGLDIYSRNEGNVSSLLKNFEDGIKNFVSFVPALSN
jgi:hypothetical protein